MIRTARQMKDLIRNMSRSTGVPQYVLIRRYMMERFLERLSLTRYRSAFVLKGGMLVSDMVGIGIRATMDIDATIKGLPLTVEAMKEVVDEIAAAEIGDNVHFRVKGIAPIMGDAEYGGIRVGLEALFDGSITPLKLDISTGDAITPEAIRYGYRLMFEDRHIDILAYPIETVLSEKLEAMLSRAETNTRMRDFYDMHVLLQNYADKIDGETLKEALKATSERRGTGGRLSDAEAVLSALEASPRMEELWKSYQAKFNYAESFAWAEVMRSARALCVRAGVSTERPSIRAALEQAKMEAARQNGEAQRTHREKGYDR